MGQDPVGTRRRAVPAARRQKTTTPNLAAQYGGNSSTGWVGYLHSSWIPYVQLARLNPPAGLFLIYFPHLFGLLYGALVERRSPQQIAEAGLLMLVGSFFVSNAIHIWNDLIDAPLDAKVRRTQQRPIPRGAVSPLAALVFTATQALAAGWCLTWLPGSPALAAWYATPAVVAWTYYPWAKRHTNFPQVVLGFCLAWGIVIGSLAIDHPPLRKVAGTIHLDGGLACLVLASLLWSMIFDTIYAHQDLEDDLQAGIGSLAVRFRERTKSVLWALLAAMAALLVACGWLGHTGLVYQCVASGGATLSLAIMIAQVDLPDTSSCWWWFGNGFWYTGAAIAGGLLAEYSYQHNFGWSSWPSVG